MNLTRPVSVGSDEKEKERKKVQRNDSFYVNKVGVIGIVREMLATEVFLISSIVNYCAKWSI